ncbi:phosphatidylinositol 3-kinase regulatory subunit alpha isoform X1 [Hylaeus volcanicus]|uniref:phosphatidylinositol 3-kinase regulatory subunit alpha isoform X1 n=2 Tax=Hylaeus volcanicus TaxID=313075 RepID=UPI0023B87164|nr:phosphatidylinositol 3-kinase regulatory subunit alpha isoform X1 [Hylaeus volcanicus]
MIGQTSEELITPATPSAEKNSKGDSKQRKSSARGFNFPWRRDSQHENAPENDEKKEDLVDVRVVECNANNVLPSKMSFNFFKNIKKYIQAKKLTICKSNKNGNEVQVSNLEKDTSCDSLMIWYDRPTISTEKGHTSEFRCENTADTSECLSNSNTSIASEESLQNEVLLENLDKTLEYCSDVAQRLEAVDARAINERRTDNYYENVPSICWPFSANSGQELVCDTTIANVLTEHRIENIQRNAEINETINNDNKVKASLTKELLKLSHNGWYWGPISGNEADSKLISEPDGAFLVRDSSDDRYVLTLSFKSSGKVLHARMEHSGGLFSLCNQSESEGFSSVADLIDYSMNFSQSGVFCYSRPKYPGHPAFPVRLTKPVSRFMQVRSLQYLCRFVIRQNMRLDNIHKLPIPKAIKSYIEEAHY